ncbi:MAG: recombinase family protein [Eggerthellaceae bacterium]|nr:recombinase family protein [Eggerthellaceae bacterium]
MNIAYVRSSSEQQNNEYQITALEKYDIGKWFVEKKSGRNTEREQLQEMLDYVREGDTVHIYNLSRLARNTKDLLNIIELLNSKSVNLISDKEAIDTHSITGKLLITVIGAVNEFMVDNQREAQMAGIAEAKKQGKYKGRKQKKINKEVWDECYTAYSKHEISKGEFAKRIGVTRPTLDKRLAEYNNGTIIFS